MQEGSVGLCQMLRECAQDRIQGGIKWGQTEKGVKGATCV